MYGRNSNIEIRNSKQIQNSNFKISQTIGLKIQSLNQNDFLIIVSDFDIRNSNLLSFGVKMKRICVIDGQGGGIGSAVIKKLKEVFEETVEIIALGTNAIATSQMLKARANRGATGENAIVRTAERVDVIIGPLSIVLAHAMMGEVTPGIAEAIAGSPARKILIPLFQENIEIAGLSPMPLPRLIDTLIQENLSALSIQPIGRA
jgi:hypothetical protein